MEPTGGIFKSAHKHFLGDAVSSFLKVGVCDTSASAKGASEIMTGSCLEVQ